MYKRQAKGPITPDTSFMIFKKSKFDVIIGMYHDQVLAPIKTMFNFNAINITLGLPFIRISPDHGPNYQMLGQKKSNPTSLKESNWKFISVLTGIIVGGIIWAVGTTMYVGETSLSLGLPLIGYSEISLSITESFWIVLSIIALIAIIITCISLEAEIGWLVISVLLGGITMVVGYFLLMILYSVCLKQIVIVDVITISLGFVIRAVTGAIVIDVSVSPWLYVCTGLAALFLGFSKRLNEKKSVGSDGYLQRETLQEYSVDFLQQLIAISATSSLLAYTLYTFTSPNLPSNNAMMLTIPFVVYGLLRYLFLVNDSNQGESPEAVSYTHLTLPTILLV